MTKTTINDDQVPMALLAGVISHRHYDRQRLVVSADLCCPPEFPAFAGHFPGQPVMPAVIQLAVVRMLASEIVNLNLQPEKIEKVKFKNMIRPDESVHVEVELQEVDGKWQAIFRLQSDHNTIATGSLLLKEKQS